MNEAIWSSDNDIKSRISIGHLAMIAARAGCQMHEPAVDRTSIDATVAPIAGAKIRLDFQVKATTKLALQGENYVFPLSKKNYDDLRDKNVDAPQLLMVLDLHETDDQWIVCEPESSILKRSAYWVSLYGWDASPNTTSVTVPIPQKNLLTPDALRDLMLRRLKALKAGQPGFAP